MNTFLWFIAPKYRLEVFGALRTQTLYRATFPGLLL